MSLMYGVYARITSAGKESSLATRPLNREAVAERALAIVDAEGPAGVSMRGLAEQLGVTAMALYNHVQDKQDVLDAVAGRVLAQIDLPDRDQPWPDRLIALFTQLRGAYLRHPRAVVLVQSATRPSSPLLAPMEHALRALADGGFDATTALEAWSGLVGLTNGHTIYQISHLVRPDGRTPADIDGQAFSAINRAMQAGPIDWDRAFATALRAQVEGLVPGPG